jgi:hypothetical protein
MLIFNFFCYCWLFLLLKAISPYAIIGYFRLYYHKLLWLFYWWLLMVINGYFKLNYHKLLWLFYYKPLIIILSVTIDGYFINSYWWLF